MPNEQLVRMLIVDDEPIICEGLRKTIDWQSLGVEVVDEAYDGAEALELVEKHGVHLVLSDIRMEGMDGLKLAELLRHNYPKVKIIIISGYEDFEYARQAMRLGVTDYLLKPVDIDELIKNVKQIISELSEENALDEGDENLFWLAGVVHQSPSYVKLTPPVPLPAHSYRVIASQLADYAIHYQPMSDEQYQVVQGKWLTRIQRFFAMEGIRCICAFDHKNMLFTLAMLDRPYSDEQWRALLVKAAEAWDEAGAMYFALSGEYDRVEQTAEASAEARKVLQYRVLEQSNAVLFPADMLQERNDRSKSASDIQELVRKLVAAMFQQKLEDVKSLIEATFASFQDRRMLLQDVVKAYEEMMVLLRLRLRQSGLGEEQLDRRASSIDLNKNNSYNSILSIALEELGNLMKQVDEQGIDRSYWVIEKAKKYMTDNYFNDIKASEVASWLKITPSYFSIIFKQSTGKSFNEFMNELRIEHAKQLLATTNDKVMDIAVSVGYKEYKYFVTVFKTYTGMTPNEYRTLNANR